MSQILNEEYFERFRAIIYNESGLHFSESNRAILESRLKERIRLSDFNTIAEYFVLVENDEAELNVLLDSVTTNLTRFFRNTAHFKTFEYHVIPDIVENKRNKGNYKIKLWSAGCSTGEEPYSLAMVLKEVLPPEFKVEIVASDLSLKSLMTAKEGFYPEIRVKDVPHSYLVKYFDKLENGFRVKDEIKALIRFDYHNLNFDAGHRDLDVVFCRNVIIYFDEHAQRQVIGKFWDSMGAYSYLFIGHSESLFGMDTNFEFVKTEWATLYRKITS